VDARLSSYKPKKPPTPFTPQLQARFLDLYKPSNSVESAASQCGISRSNIYERALKGRRRPIYQGGKLVGEEWILSDNLLMARLRKHDPQGYGTSRHRHDGQVDTTLQVNIMKFGTDKQGNGVTWTVPVVVGPPLEPLPRPDDDDAQNKPSAPDGQTQIEPHRLSRRLQLLRGLQHEQIETIFPRG